MARLDLMALQIQARWRDLGLRRSVSRGAKKMGRPLINSCSNNQAAAKSALLEDPHFSQPVGKNVVKPRTKHPFEEPYIKSGDYGKIWLLTTKPTASGDKFILLHYRDLCEHAVVTGGSGSGKTGSFMDPIHEGVFRASHLPDGPDRERLKFGALIIEAKGDFKEKNYYNAARFGRLEDLIMFGPDHPNKYDVFGDPTETIVQRVNKMLTIFEAVSPAEATEDPFWREAARKLFTNIFNLHRAIRERWQAAPTEKEKANFVIPPLSFKWLNLLLMDKGKPINEEWLAEQRKAVDQLWTRVEDVVARLRLELLEFEQIFPELARVVAEKEISVLGATNDAFSRLSADCDNFDQLHQLGQDVQWRRNSKCIEKFRTLIFSDGERLNAVDRGRAVNMDLKFLFDFALDAITSWINKPVAARLDEWNTVSTKILAPHRFVLEQNLQTTFSNLERLTGIEIQRKFLTLRTLFEDLMALNKSILDLSGSLTEPEIGALRKALDQYEAILAERGINRLHDELTAYFHGEYLNVANDKASGSVAMVASTMISMLVQEPFDRLFAPGGTFNFNEAIDQGRIVYLDMPKALSAVMQTVASIALKLDFFRAILMRPIARVLLPDGTLGDRLINQDRFMMFFADEYASIATSGREVGEADCMEKARQSLCAFFLSFQAVSALRTALDETEIKSLLSNARIKVFLANDDDETQEAAGRAMGKKYKVQMSMQRGAVETTFNQGRTGERPFTTSYALSHRFDPSLLVDLDKGEALVTLPQRYGKAKFQRISFVNGEVNAKSIFERRIASGEIKLAQDRGTKMP